MNLTEFEKSKHSISPDEAKNQLIHLLQLAHAGEKAAANAYYGHYKSLFVRNKIEKNEIKNIYNDELHHRSRINEILIQLNAKPNFKYECVFFITGFIIGCLCLFGGWFIPMYGAGKLESTNIEEYEVAARLAHLAGFTELTEELLTFAEIEWDHELYFRNKSKKHFLYTYFPKWKLPKNREKIKNDFINYKDNL